MNLKNSVMWKCFAWRAWVVSLYLMAFYSVFEYARDRFRAVLKPKGSMQSAVTTNALGPIDFEVVGPGFTNDNARTVRGIYQ